MDIVISNTSDKPIYQQIYEQISAQIIKGKLKKDYCLPPIRTIAKELRISVITVKKAWEELERNGFIYSVVGKGCFVSPMQHHELINKRDELISEKLKKDIGYYKSLGLSLSDIIKLIERSFNSLDD
ncbi:MAG: GntR family transcriptional regulator [Eubacteriales bacterium]